MKTAASVLTSVALAAVLSLLGGCTYVCHRYEEFDAVIPGNGWRIEGSVYRQHAEGRAPTKYSLPHWGARDDDRYSLELVPVAPDSAFWVGGDVEIIGVRVIADQDTMNLRWAECDHTYERVIAERKVLHSAGGYFSRTPYSKWYDESGYELAFRRYTFNSEYFQLKKPVPDVLTIEYELVLLDKATREPISRWKFRSEAVVNRHRRWVVMDGIES